MRQASAMRTQTVPSTPVHEETPEDQPSLPPPTSKSSWQFPEPTSIRNSSASSRSPTPVQPASNDLSPVEALSRALGARQSVDAVTNGQSLENDFDAQNMQSRKEAFLAAARSRQADDYLRSTREAPRSPATKSKQAGRFQRCRTVPQLRPSWRVERIGEIQTFMILPQVSTSSSPKVPA